METAEQNLRNQIPEEYWDLIDRTPDYRPVWDSSSPEGWTIEMIGEEMSILRLIESGQFNGIKDMEQIIRQRQISTFEFGSIADSSLDDVKDMFLRGGLYELALRETISQWVWREISKIYHISQIIHPKIDGEKQKVKKPKFVNGYVYLIRCNDTKQTKIGISIDPKSRLKQIAQQRQTDIEMIWSSYHENYQKVELSLHNTYADFRLRGEWFDLNHDQITNIKTFLSDTQLKDSEN